MEGVAANLKSDLSATLAQQKADAQRHDKVVKDLSQKLSAAEGQARDLLNEDSTALRARLKAAIASEREAAAEAKAAAREKARAEAAQRKEDKKKAMMLEKVSATTLV